jgi:hypothetical protein
VLAGRPLAQAHACSQVHRRCSGIAAAHYCRSCAGALALRLLPLSCALLAVAGVLALDDRPAWPLTSAGIAGQPRLVPVSPQRVGEVHVVSFSCAFCVLSDSTQPFAA